MKRLFLTAVTAAALIVALMLSGCLGGSAPRPVAPEIAADGSGGAIIVWPEGGISVSASPFDVNQGQIEMINESLIVQYLRKVDRRVSVTSVATKESVPPNKSKKG